ncbi:hypothetical protein BKA81DRAFT_214406 [Phyllosticta paracitricarpa]
MQSLSTKKVGPRMDMEANLRYCNLRPTVRRRSCLSCFALESPQQDILEDYQIIFNFHRGRHSGFSKNWYYSTLWLHLKSICPLLRIKLGSCCPPLHLELGSISSFDTRRGGCQTYPLLLSARSLKIPICQAPICQARLFDWALCATISGPIESELRTPMSNLTARFRHATLPNSVARSSGVVIRLPWCGRTRTTKIL